MRALVTGAGGQLGVELLRTAPKDVTVTAVTHAELDISDDAAVNAIVEREKPDLIINAAAYNAVDEAERQSDLAYRVNATGPANLAGAADRARCRIIHISTDYVFDGKSTTPYTPTDRTNPLNTYGKSKLAGEREVAKAAPDHLIIRTSWLFSSHGRGFLQIILAALREGKTVRGVIDQASVPTACRGLAEVIWLCAARGGPKGISHWVDAGKATRYDQAVAIREMAMQYGLISGTNPVEKVLSKALRPLAVRPRYSVMDASALATALGKKQRHWKEWLAQTVEEIYLQKPITPGRRD